jgi:hypothetical protein
MPRQVQPSPTRRPSRHGRSTRRLRRNVSACPGARLPDGNVLLIKRATKIVERIGFTALLLALLGIDGCGSSSSVCAGNISCRSKTGDQCGVIPGCKSTPGCIHYGAALDSNCVNISEEKCSSPYCAWLDNVCQSACVTITSDIQCASYSFQVTVAPNMTVTVGPCVWSQCSGVPDNPYCSRYPVNMCPGNMGCGIQQTCSWGDC